jgi:glycosyltransferase involved in cell wall biosynthesis
MPAVAIIPAYNEAPRIGAVLLAALGAKTISRVLVVDDGSTDGTADVASGYGVEVLRLSPNRGKGGAMLEGVARSSEPVVCFLDADLIGILPAHIDAMVAPVLRGEFSMVAGLSDHGLKDFWGKLQPALPLITGQRAVQRAVLAKVPLSFWRGYRIEVAINELARRAGPVGTIVLPGVFIVLKWQKINPRKGLENEAKMAREVLIALAQAQQIPYGAR